MKKLLSLFIALAIFPASFAVATPLRAGDALERPQRQGKRGMRKPPQAAFDACSGASEGDACSFSNRRGDEMTGTCTTSPRGDGEIFCRPEGMPPR